MRINTYGKKLLFQLATIAHAVFFQNLCWASLPKLPALIVDKKTNSLNLVQFEEKSFNIVKTYHTTLGLVPGDKEREGDKKTPEGIYFFDEVRRPPNLLKKFGKMAITMNYPNPWDRLMHKTGSGIWLHATNEPQRLSKDFDSLGCVVVKDDEIEELYTKIFYKVSPIIVYDDFEKQKSLLTPDRATALEQFITNWAHNWESKNIESYIASYDSHFSNTGKRLNEWRKFKEQLNRSYDKINVNIDGIFVFSHPKYDVAVFNQKYVSRFKNGSIAKQADGIKILYLTKESNQPRILAEEFRETTL